MEVDPDTASVVWIQEVTKKVSARYSNYKLINEEIRTLMNAWAKVWYYKKE